MIEGFNPPFLRGLGWSLDELTEFQTEVKRDLQDKRIHAYQIM